MPSRRPGGGDPTRGGPAHGREDPAGDEEDGERGTEQGQALETEQKGRAGEQEEQE
jgi:hypothetical protein